MPASAGGYGALDSSNSSNSTAPGSKNRLGTAARPRPEQSLPMRRFLKYAEDRGIYGIHGAEESLRVSWYSL